MMECSHKKRADISPKNVWQGRLEGRGQSRATYHLHGKTGNPCWKIKWFVPFCLGNVRKYGLGFVSMQFFCSFQVIGIYFVAVCFPTLSNL